MIEINPGAEAVYQLVEEVEAAVPFWRFFSIFRDKPYAYFLDSSLADNRLGTYSFMGSDPFLVYRAHSQEDHHARAGVRVTLEAFPDVLAGGARTAYVAPDLFEDLRAVYNRYKLSAWEGGAELPAALPFRAGAVGYLAYEAGSMIEHIPVPVSRRPPLPLACFLFVDFTLGYCHRTHRTFMSIVGRGATDGLAREAALRRKHWLLDAIQRVNTSPMPPDDQAAVGNGRGGTVLFEAEHDRHSYCAAVNTIKEHIREGAAYEVCLTHGFSCVQTKDVWSLYRTLRDINPAPFSSFLKFPEATVVCSSPERFLRLSGDRMIESRPIKGTRPRGGSPLHDLKLQDELCTSEKDRAENLMIVDLVRNDLSRVSEVGSVHVPELLQVERYATVLQLVSTIQAKLRAGCDAFDLLKASFPGGSMTGAPKIQAMKIIASLEKSRREIYSGAIGYIDFAGEMDLNIVIRSIVVREGRCYFNVGGAVVSDSDPEAEYQETLDKARALVAALRA